MHSNIDSTWQLLLAVAALRRAKSIPAVATGYSCQANGSLLLSDADDANAQLISSGDGFFHAGPALTGVQNEFVEMYLPLLAANPLRTVVIGHLGQSVDGQIATETGDSHYVTGHQNFVHMHRLRALCDAVVVGASTVLTDDPRLTTRMVEGPNPVRIVIDPESRLETDLGVFSDSESPTIRVVASNSDTESDATTIALPIDESGLPLDLLLESLSKRGLSAIFVEGGGVTVTRWMEAGLLDRLHLAMAPVLVGAGRVGLQLDSASSMQSSLRPAFRLYRMGNDILWDFDLKAPGDIQSDAYQGAECPTADSPFFERIL